MAKPPSTIVYHYTSGAALLEILKTGSIWASSIHHLNDSAEFSHAIDLASISLIQLGNAGTAKEKTICESMIDQLERRSDYRTYVACFSCDHGDTLSQWRGYCPQGFGYSVGFDSDQLKTLAERGNMLFEPCIYDETRKRNLVNSWAEDTLRKLSAAINDGAVILEAVEQLAPTVIEKFIRIAPFLKDSHFSEEREWRFVAFVPINDERVQLRPAKNMLVPYVSVGLEVTSAQSPIWQIIIGPTPHPHLAISSLSYYLTRVHIANGITHSHIPYRDW